jgi:Zn-dependent protease
VAHGWVALRCGDKTAWMLGRLTLNPIKHIDPIGTILVPGLLLISFTGFIFGWAKPVPVNSRNLRNPKRDMAYVAVAGPAANVLMAIAWALIARIAVTINVESVSLPLIYMGAAGITINLVLALVNLLPIPPLDGSRIMASLLPNRWAWYYNQIERFGFIILIAMLYTGVLSSILGYPLFALQNIFYDLAGLSQ